MKYKAIFLDDKEFESLPYRDMGDKIGVADPRTGTAYARKSGMPVIDAFTIMHELEHLEEGHGGEHADHFDPEHGVYYKGFGNLFSALGGAANSIGGGLSNIGGAVSRGAGAVTRGIGGLFGGGQGAGQQAPKPTFNPSATTSSAQGVNSMAFRNAPSSFAFNQPSPVSGTGPVSKTFNPMQQFGQSSFSQLQSTFNRPGMPNTSQIQSSLGGGGGTGTRYGAPPMSRPSVDFNSVANSAMNLFGNMGRGGGMQPPSPQPQAPQPSTSTQTSTSNQTSSNPLQSIFGKDANLGQVGAGTALAGFGQLASPKVNLPNLAELPNVQALQNMNFRNFQELDPALEQATNRDFDMIDARERDRLIATYKSLRPGADIESDSSFRRDMDELQRMQGMRRADSLAKYRFEYLSKQLQMSELEMRQMTELAYMDIATIMLQLGVDAQAAQDFKAAFTGVGTAMVSKGLGINQEQPANANQPA